MRKLLPATIEELEPDLVIANAENLTHGDGFAPNHIAEMQEAGADFFTSGNHIWGNQKGVIALDDPSFPVLRPANFPNNDAVPGDGYRVVEARDGGKVLVINLMGQTFMSMNMASPFHRADEILAEFEGEDLAAIFVDFHAEASSEKYALTHYLDGRVSAVVGTHTHVQTNDAHVMKGGTAHMTDAGLTGPFESIIGLKAKPLLNRFLNQTPVRHEPEDQGKMVLQGMLVEIDNGSKKALNVSHVQKFL